MAFLLMAFNCQAKEADQSLKQFNATCPAQQSAPIIDNFYHECHSGMIRNEYNSCERFIALFKELMSEYDCARKIDMSGQKKYVVPALWLLSDGQFSDYHALIHALVFDKMYSIKEYANARNQAKSLFFSKEFQRVLDAGGEEYQDEWEAHENEKK